MNNRSLVCALRGPVLLITIGVLFALDHEGSFPVSRTWPVLIIVLGLMKLAERFGPDEFVTPAPPPPYGGVR